MEFDYSLIIGSKKVLLKKIDDVNPARLTYYAEYLAGLLDGEASFSLFARKRKHNVTFSACIALGMTHEETIKFVAHVFGVNHKHYKSKKKPHKDVFCLRVTTKFEVEQICLELENRSRTKKHQIKLLREYFELCEDKKSLHRIRDKKERKDITLEMIDVFIELKKANQRGIPPDYEATRQKYKKVIIDN